MPQWLTQTLYLVSAVLFIYGIKRLNSPATARRGNLVSLAGMLIAMLVTLVDPAVVSYRVILAGIVVGTALGLWQAYAVRMTAMPQMVALLNGFGGGASMVVSAAEFLRAHQLDAAIPTQTGVVMQAGLLVGGVTLTGSLVAFAKLQELLPGRPTTFPGQNVANLLVFLVIVGMAGWQVSTEAPLIAPFWLLCALSLVLGVMLVLPIGGADMPVVISLLNSYSGIAAAMTGFVIANEVLIIAGALVGSSGIILSQVMCKAMNRSLTNVLFGAFGATASASGGKTTAGLTVKSITPEDLAIQIAYAQKMIVVPGYGMAVAQAQHQVRELAELVEKRGGQVKYAIHPVAGRMPGHMNVLLAEANVPYDRLYEMDDINHEFADADVCLVIGANDVVNPAARSDKSSPIYGMPILNADHAKMTIVCKRSMAAGFAGVDNELFFGARTWMLFGDAKQSLQTLIAEVKQA